MRDFLKYVVFFIASFLISLFTLHFYTNNYIDKIVNERFSIHQKKESTDIDLNSLSIKEVHIYIYKYLKSKKVRWAKTCVAQFILESGNFKDKIYKDYRNFTGMKKPGIRPSIFTDVGGDNYLIYSSSEECLEDYIYFYSHYANVENQLDIRKWYKLLDSFYCKNDPYYSQKIQKIEKQLVYLN